MNSLNKNDASKTQSPEMNKIKTNANKFVMIFVFIFYLSLSSTLHFKYYILKVALRANMLCTEIASV